MIVPAVVRVPGYTLYEPTRPRLGCDRLGILPVFGPGVCVCGVSNSTHVCVSSGPGVCVKVL